MKVPFVYLFKYGKKVPREPIERLRMVLKVLRAFCFVLSLRS